jgi:hypothetical protein
MPGRGARCGARGQFWVANRLVSLYRNWAVSVSLVTIIIGHGARGRYIEISYISLPQRPIAFRGIIQLGSRLVWLLARANASIAIGRALSRLQR